MGGQRRLSQMDKRFEAVDRRFDVVDTKLNDVGQALQSIQASLGKPFEQFARNVVCRILEGEGMKNVTLKASTFTRLWLRDTSPGGDDAR